VEKSVVDAMVVGGGIGGPDITK